MPTSDEDFDPLPYVISFAVLTVIFFIVISWAIHVNYQDGQCRLNPDIWCSDTWTCNTATCSGDGYNACFANVGPTGLASCLYGPGTQLAKYCLTPPPSGGVSCACVQEMAGSQNCMGNCAPNLGKSPGTCCCCPGYNGCPGTKGQPPPSSCIINPGDALNCPGTG